MPYARLIYITYQLVKNTQEKTQEKKSPGGIFMQFQNTGQFQVI